MKKFGFLIGQSLHTLLYGWRINLFVLVSFALGLVLPYLALGNINVFMRSIDSVQINNANDIVLASSPSSEWIDEEDVKKSLQLTNETNIGILAQGRAMARSPHTQSEVRVVGVTAGVLHYEKMPLSAGRAFSDDEVKNNRHVCMVEEGLVSNYGAIIPGDTLMVSEEAYQVIGILYTINPKLNSSIIFPYATFQDVIGKNEISLTYYLPLHIYDNQTRRLLEDMNPIEETWKADEYSAHIMQNGFRQSFLLLFICLIALLFALINISCVIVGRFYEAKYSLGVRRALGANSVGLWAHYFCEQLIIMLISTPIMAIASNIIMKYAPKGVYFIIDLRVYAATLAMGIFMCFSCSIILVKKALRLNIADIMRGAS